jgi:hypothetical protein
MAKKCLMGVSFTKFKLLNLFSCKQVHFVLNADLHMLEAMVSQGCLNYPTAGRLASAVRAWLGQGTGPA